MEKKRKLSKEANNSGAICFWLIISAILMVGYEIVNNFKESNGLYGYWLKDTFLFSKSFDIFFFIGLIAGYCLVSYYKKIKKIKMELKKPENLFVFFLKKSFLL